MPTPSLHALLLLLLIVASAAAQPNDWRDRIDDDDDDDGRRMSPGARARRQQPPPSFSAPMVVLLVALIAVFVFIGFFSIYIRQCGGRGGASSSGPAIPAAALLALSRQEEQHNQQRDGLDPALVASFPTMTYAEARALRVPDDDAMAVLECAVCLSEFEGDEELRLLPKCSHAFHPDCIGEWLAGHATCPVCRRSLKPDDHKEDSLAPRAAAAEANGSAEQQQDQVGIDVNGEEEEERRRELDRIGSQRRVMRSRSGRSISRAHSTGHSLSLSARRPREPDLERFTLRLPEQLRREMEAESLRRAVARDYDGGSSSRPAARSARIGRSDRWQQQQSFIARTFSSSRVPFWGAAASRRAPDAEAIAGAGAPAGSTTTTTPAVTTTTGQGRAVREKTADGSVGSAKAGSLRFDCLGGGGAVAADDDSENEAEEEKAIVRRA